MSRPLHGPSSRRAARATSAVVIALLGTGLVGAVPALPAARAETIAITGATVHSVTADEPLREASIVIRDGRIIAVGSKLEIPNGARVIDARGKIVTPGLMSSQTVLGLTEINSADASVDHVTTAGPFGASFDVEYALNAESPLLRQARADGLTRAVSAPTGSAQPPFQGTGVVLRLVDGTDIVDVPAAGIFVAVGTRAADRTGGSRSGPWLHLRAALDAARPLPGDPAKTTEKPVRRAAEKPSSLKNAAEPRKPASGSAEARALAAVFSGKTPLVIAASRASDIRQAIRLADDYGIRIIVAGGEEAWRVARELAVRDIPVLLDPTSDEMSSLDTIGARPDCAALLQRAGVRIAFAPNPGSRGTYDGGVMLREASGYAVAAGLSWIEALRAITINPARIWGIADRYGAIEPGQEADLVIWDGDPFEVTTIPLAVFARGQQVSQVTRQQLLRDRYAPAMTVAPQS